MSQTPDTPPVASPRVVTTDIACVTCDYNLRGLAVGGDCPECGTAVALSLGAARVLTRRDLTTLCLRLLAVVVLIWYLPQVIVGLTYFVVAVVGGYGSQWAYSLVYAFGIAVICIGGIALWQFAPWLAVRLFGKDAAVARSGRLTRTNIMLIGVTLLGAYFTIEGAAGIADFVAERGLMMYWSDPQLQDPTLYDFVRLILGVLLIWKAPTLGVWAARRVRGSLEARDRITG